MSEITTSLASLGGRLKTENLTCIVQKDGRTFTSKLRGIRPLLDWIAQGEDLHGAFAGSWAKPPPSCTL